MIDHNVHLSLGAAEFEKQARRKLSDADTWTVINLLIGRGLLTPFSDTLQGFFDRLIVEADNDGTVINVQISQPE
jgi:hypothetical protein